MRASSTLNILKTLLLAVILLFAVAAPTLAQDTVSRAQIEAEIAAGATPEDIDKKYGGAVAAEDAATEASDLSKAAEIDVQIITNTGSTAYEAIKACGYHPQREELTCTIEIRRRFGFGGRICNSNGSHELVHFCVDYGGGLVPVHINGFHIHDEMFGVQPNWYFSAVVQSDWRLLSQLNNGRTLKARAILAWNQVLGGGANYCNLNPIWGNRADFKIRLDP